MTTLMSSCMFPLASSTTPGPRPGRHEGQIKRRYKPRLLDGGKVILRSYSSGERRRMSRMRLDHPRQRLHSTIQAPGHTPLVPVDITIQSNPHHPTRTHALSPSFPSSFPSVYHVQTRPHPRCPTHSTEMWEEFSLMLSGRKGTPLSEKWDQHGGPCHIPHVRPRAVGEKIERTGLFQSKLEDGGRELIVITKLFEPYQTGEIRRVSLS